MISQENSFEVAADLWKRIFYYKPECYFVVYLTRIILIHGFEVGAQVSDGLIYNSRYWWTRRFICQKKVL